MDSLRSGDPQTGGLTLGQPGLRSLLAMVILPATVLVLAADVNAEPTEGRDSAHAPQSDSDYHTVSEGETLYDIAGRYFDDPLEWPRLWSYNPHITNPHWVYPGDVVYLKPEPDPAGHTQAPRADSGDPRQNARTGDRSAEQTDTDSEVRDRLEIRMGSQLEPGLRLQVGGFLSDEQPHFVGRIVASPKPARMMAGYDTVWIGLGSEAYTEADESRTRRGDRLRIEEPERLEQGSRFGIVRSIGKTEDENGDVIGTKYLVVGSLVVTDVRPSEGELETALIDQAWAPVERGDFLVPYERQLNVIQHVPAQKDLAATIIDRLEGGFSFGEFDYVFVDKGAADGIRIGNRAFIYQRRAGVGTRWESSGPPKGIPWQSVGRLRFVDVREDYSTAIVTDARREIEIGDRLELYAGK